MADASVYIITNQAAGKEKVGQEAAENYGWEEKFAQELLSERRKLTHDLRSPLTALNGYLELVRRAGPVNEKQAEYLRMACQAVEEITQLLRAAG